MRNIIVIISVFVIGSCKKEPAAPLPVANFYVDNAFCTAPCQVKFFDQSYSAVGWKWYFGNSLTSHKENDSSLYHTAGFYDVSLAVWNADGVRDSITKQIQLY